MDALVRVPNPPPLFRRLILTEPEVGRPARPLPQRQHQTHLDPVRRQELIDRYLAGERAFRLAEAFDLDRRTVADIVMRAGVRRPWAMTDKERADTVRLYRAGWSCQRIGDHLERDDETIRQALKRAGVQLREPWQR